MSRIEQHEIAELFGIESKSKKVLILFNDNHNDFDFVITSLIKVCNHTDEQAAQCAFTAHTKGKCNVKSGSYEEISPMKEALISRGLNVIIQ